MDTEGRIQEDNSEQQPQEFKKFDENQNIYKQMFQFSPFAIFIHDIDMNIIDANDKAVDQFGYSKQELLKTNVNDLQPESELENSAKVLEKIRTKDKLSFETSFVKKDGSVFLAEATPFRYRINDKDLIHVYIQDITSQKQDELKLHKALEQAKESDRLKTAFLANMSHEIRTPLNGIFGFLELLQNAKLSGEEQDKFIDIIERSGQRMLNTINDIIEISRIESGLVDVNLHETNINEQLKFVYTFFKQEAENKGLNLDYAANLSDEKAVVVTDQEKLSAILSNLVKNAIKHTEEGSIKLGYTVKKKVILFYVKDTGIGIPEDRQEAIFERFIQADILDRQAREGAGLGLTISKAYLEMLGGEFCLESKLNEGTIFYFTIPYNTNKKEVEKFLVSDKFKERKQKFNPVKK